MPTCARSPTTCSPRASPARHTSAAIPFHVQISQSIHSARAFNLSDRELEARLLAPWRRGERFELGGRPWEPADATLEIREGRELRPDELALGRGWNNARRASADVTAHVLERAGGTPQAAAAVAEPPALEAFKSELLTLAGPGRLAVQAVVGLANVRFPATRASDRLALAEQAVWELLHQGRVRLIEPDPAGPREVPRVEWERTVLAWETWTGTGTAPVELVTIPPVAEPA